MSEQLLPSAQLHFLNRQFELAKSICLQIIDEHEDNQFAHELLVQIWFELGDLNKAVHELKYLVQLNPGSLPFRFQLSQFLLQLNRFEEANQVLVTILDVEDKNASVHRYMAICQENMGDFEAAEIHYQKALSVFKEDSYLWFCLGKIQSKLKKFQNAIQSFKNALSIHPGLVDAYELLGLILLDSNGLEQAIALFQQALRLEPKNVNILAHLGYAYLHSEKVEMASENFTKALQINPNHPIANIGRAEIYQRTGHIQHALDIYNFLSDHYPNQLDILIRQARLFEKSGQIQRAYDLLKPLIDKKIYEASLARIWGILCLRLGFYSEGLVYVQNVIHQKTDLLPRWLWPLYFRLGELHDALGHYKQAFQSFERANCLKPQNFSIENFQKHISCKKQVFTANFFQKMPTGNQSTVPVFIVGMPRSGTTLVEQILSCDDTVFGAGELEFMIDLWDQFIEKVELNETSWREVLLSLNSQSIQHLSNTYLEKLIAKAPLGARYICDKMPANFHHLGFIQLLFPNAKIIHCQRAALDTCWSCYTQDFNKLIYTNDLKKIAYYYLEYQNIMKHWSINLNLNIHNVVYEDLVQNPKDTIYQILDFLGLEKDSKFLRFHKHKRNIQTASYHQVRQEIYTHSIGRSDPYRPWLQDIIDILKVS